MRLLVYFMIILVISSTTLAKKPKRSKDKNRAPGSRAPRRPRPPRKPRPDRHEGRTAPISYQPPLSGQRIRLGGAERLDLHSGNIEVFLRHQWGIVCDDQWTEKNAGVACKQLGFKRGVRAVTSESAHGGGSWMDSDILLDDVDCNGDEQALHTCNYVYPSNCHRGEAAGVVCEPNSGCPDNWIAGPSSCYLLSNITTTQRKYAEKKCANQGGHLVNIETQAENHFLSMLFLNTTGPPIITGGLKEGKDWVWERMETVPVTRQSGRKAQFGRTASSSTPTRDQKVQVAVEFTKWFPGWMPGYENSEPSGKRNEKCLYLTSQFTYPGKDKSLKEVGYLYWSDDICKRTRKRMVQGFRYLCEKSQRSMPGNMDNDNKPEQNGVANIVEILQECVEGNGQTYTGIMDHTEKGTPCILWELSDKYKKHTSLALTNLGLHDHNHCRNPDNDVRPWCYVNREGSFGFCPIPHCNEANVTTTTPLPTTTQAVSECPDDKFYCAQSIKCISVEWRCDQELDCEGGDDETGCTYVTEQFKKTPYTQVLGRLIKETFMGGSNETCSRLCLAAEAYICDAFDYSPSERRCHLTSGSRHEADPLIWSHDSHVYQLISQLGDCESQFKCGNGRCIDVALLCDHTDNCGDFSDEKDCGNSEAVEVRLVGGDDEQSGRVEVKYLGEWGVICDDKWDNTDAEVICGMLGYHSGSPVATGVSRFGSGNGQFFLDEVQCTGTEDSIVDCPHDGWKVHDCRSFEVAGVVCNAQKDCKAEQYTCKNGNCLEASLVCDGTCNCLPDCQDENGDGVTDCRTASLELVNGTRISGRVEITRNGLRGTVCDDKWDHEDATVVCKMLGFRSGVAVFRRFGEGKGPIWLDDVECTGQENSLTNCKSSNWGISDCGHSEDAGVICLNSSEPVTTTPMSAALNMVTLVDGSSPSEGRVEVIINSRVGTICDDDWDDMDATVVCKMLGYSYGVAQHDLKFGPGSDSIEILLDDVACDGSEQFIADCKHAGLGVHNCAHGEDAGVICYHGNEATDPNTDDVLSKIACGRRPSETKSRKKREEPWESEENRLADLPKFARIVGGFTATRGFYPWQVGVRKLVQNQQYSHWCGGTILNEHWILSAAHCFQDTSKGHIIVRTGDHDNKIEEEHEQEFELEKLLSHPAYNSTNFDFDLALLKVKHVNGEGIKFSDHVQPACLPDENDPYTPGTKCHVSGWGKTENGYQNLLKSAQVPLIDDATCERLYKTISRNMVCAGFLKGGIDSCSGDSGGPLVCTVDGRYTVMGATSWGAGCAMANAPGVYARVTAFLPWIKQTLQTYS